MLHGGRRITTFCLATVLVWVVFHIAAQEYFLSTEYSVSDGQFDILVNSYMRSGSSFLGRLLTWHADAFYWYEPLWNYDSGVYYWGSDKICVGKTMCGIARNKTRHNITRVLATFDDIYNCNLRSLSEAVSEHLTPYQSGFSWKSYEACRKKKTLVSECLGVMESSCRNAKHRATKTVRLTLDNAGKILESKPKVKLVHLIRDPRAIMNSRITTQWFGVKEYRYNNYKLLAEDTADLCNRMKHDLRVSITLKQKYPERFIVVMFEDIVDKRALKSNILDKFFGIEKKQEDNEDDTFIDVLQEEHALKKISADYRRSDRYADWWRLQISFKAMQVVDKTCFKVLEVLGYRTFRNVKELRDLTTVKAFSINQQLRLENIFELRQYKFNI